MTLPLHDQHDQHDQDAASVPSRPDNLVQRVINWLRAGYPEGVPKQDYVALLGILRRTLTATELDRVVAELASLAESGMQIMTPELVAQRITDVVQGPVDGGDIVRVSARLAAAGWPLGSPIAGDPDLDGSGPDADAGLVTKVVDWLRAGYPTGVPDRDFVPLLALLRRRLSDEEVRLVAHRLVETGVLPGDRVDIAAAIAAVTAELPSEQDMARVSAALSDPDWPAEPA